MAVYATLFNRATTHPGLSALIGTRFYPGALPQNATLPAVTYRQISGPDTAGTTGVSHPRYQFDCWGSTYIDASNVADQVEAAFRDHVAADSPAFRGGRRASRLDVYEPATDRFRVVVDLRLSIIE